MVPLHHVLERRIWAVDQVRWLISLGLFALVTITASFTLPLRSVLPCVGIVLGTVVYYLLLYRILYTFLVVRSKRFYPFSFLQTIVNLLAMSLMVYWTGGGESYVYVLYLFEIIIGGIIVLPQSSYLIATLAWLAYALLLALEHFGLIPHIPLPGAPSSPPPLFYLGAMGRLIAIAYTTVFIGHYILRERSRELSALANKLAQVNMRLRQLAITDGLTDLFNYRYFIQRLEDEILRAKRYKRDFSLILFDLDNFKACNDQLGHLFGDIVLKRLAHLMRNNTRAVDVVARYGGEEFVAILPETPREGAMVVAERIRDAFQSHLFDSTSPSAHLILTLSGGIAVYPHDGETVSQLIGQADQALYLAKQRGKNTIVAAEHPAPQAP